ncbi:MAG: menaquinone biosynthesis protein [Deltaproteobacteria bacterium]|nr:menaquinone biosynthesis protein [Deltaproteobacteria bacterium]
MKLGYIDYLNCYPFYYHQFEKEKLDGVEIVPAYPSDLNHMMTEGKLDLSPISAATYAGLEGKIRLLPDFCLSSIGYVGSVILRSKIPIEELDGRSVGITRASHTSAVLLRILMEDCYNIRPDYRETLPSPDPNGLDAALLIGNEAMTASRKPVSYSYDLGELWLRKTGFPVVFAVFAVREEALAEKMEQIRAVVRSYRTSLQCLANHPDQVIAGARARYPDIIYDIGHYYSLLRFDFSAELKKALEYYLGRAAELGFLQKIEGVRYLEME